MSERTVSIAEAKARLSELVAAVEAGEEVTITKRGRTVAALVPRVPPRAKKPIDLEWLRERTKGIPYQEEDSGTFIRRIRDTDRY